MPHAPTGRALPAPAFETLWEPLRPQLKRAALSLAGNAEDAEDLLQETGLRAFRGYDQFKPDSNFPGWAFCILRNTWHTTWRAQRRAQVALPWEEVAERGEEWLQDTFDHHRRTEPERAILGGVADEEIESALAGLPASFRVVFELAHLRGQSYAEIARALSLPLGTVRSRLSRARDRLRAKLTAYALRRGLVRLAELRPPERLRENAD